MRLEKKEKEREIIALQYQIKQIENQREYLSDLKRCEEIDNKDQLYYLRNVATSMELEK